VTAAVAGRWQRGIDQERPGIEPVSLPVAETLRRFYVDDLVHDDAVLELLARTFGAEQVLAGSDWPFPMGSDVVSAGRAADRAAAVEAMTRPLALEVTEW
jgi:aminocarboxymuconate-semialdehyde decarboxylase